LIILFLYERITCFSVTERKCGGQDTITSPPPTFLCWMFSVCVLNIYYSSLFIGLVWSFEKQSSLFSLINDNICIFMLTNCFNNKFTLIYNLLVHILYRQQRDSVLGIACPLRCRLRSVSSIGYAMPRWVSLVTGSGFESGLNKLHAFTIIKLK